MARDQPEPAAAVEPVVAPDVAPGPEPLVLSRGAVVDLDGWSLSITWPDRPERPTEIDAVAFVLDADDQVRGDADFCFYNQPIHPTGAVDLDLDTTNEALAVLHPSALPDDQQRVVFGAAIDAVQTPRGLAGSC